MYESNTPSMGPRGLMFGYIYLIFSPNQLSVLGGMSRGQQVHLFFSFTSFWTYLYFSAVNGSNINHRMIIVNVILSLVHLKNAELHLSLMILSAILEAYVISIRMHCALLFTSIKMHHDNFCAKIMICRDGNMF